MICPFSEPGSFNDSSLHMLFYTHVFCSQLGTSCFIDLLFIKAAETHPSPLYIVVIKRGGTDDRISTAGTKSTKRADNG